MADIDNIPIADMIIGATLTSNKRQYVGIAEWQRVGKQGRDDSKKKFCTQSPYIDPFPHYMLCMRLIF